MFLLDTNVVSATAPNKRDRFPVLVKWIGQTGGSLYISAITVSEIHAGLAKLQRSGATRQVRLLTDWWSLVERFYSERILAFDLDCATQAGRFLDDARAFDPGFEDIAIAATAKVHGLTVLTANVRHFEPLGVPVVNPFVALPVLPPSA